MVRTAINGARYGVLPESRASDPTYSLLVLFSYPLKSESNIISFALSLHGPTQSIAVAGMFNRFISGHVEVGQGDHDRNHQDEEV